MATPQIIIVKKTAKKRRPRRDRSPESRRRKHEMHRKNRAMQGGFLPQLTAYNIAKVVKPASRISEIVDIIPGACGKLKGNAIGCVFLKGLDLGKSFGFGHPHRKRRSHKRKSHSSRHVGKGAGTHSTRMHRRKAVHKRGRGMIIA